MSALAAPTTGSCWSDISTRCATPGSTHPGYQEAWARYRATPAFGLGSWLHTLSVGSFQAVDVCLATLRRFAAAYEDLETHRSLVAGGTKPAI